MLLRMLYEVDAPDKALAATQSIVEVPAMWRYREQISLQHAQVSLQNIQRDVKKGADKKKKESAFQILNLFMKEVCSG